MSAEIDGSLWEHNFARVILVDVSDDYRCGRQTQAAESYPVVEELWLPRVNLPDVFTESHLREGYLYHWHQPPRQAVGDWYVGVVHRESVLGPNRI